MRRYSNAVVVAAVGITATKFTEIIKFGPPQPQDPPALDVVSQAGADPTITRSVSFKPLEAYRDELGEDSGLRIAEWTWRRLLRMMKCNIRSD